MKTLKITRRSLTIALVIAACSASSRAASHGVIACLPDENGLIDSEVHCFPGGGLNINYYGDDGIKVACMKDKQVQSTCGPDGRLTRQQAYRNWFHKLQQFQAHCETSGGTFAYQDPNFVEPTDESFCLQAQPEVGTNMFEDSLCNYHSVCPAISVSCSYDCTHARSAYLDSQDGPSTVTLKNR